MSARMFERADTNKDGFVSADDPDVADEEYYLWPRVRFVNEGTTTLYGT